MREDWRPYIVAVCGETCFTPADGRFVRNTIHRLTFAKRRTHYVSFHLAASPGAADFRSAWALMDCAHALIAFEPLDLIARYSLHWGATVPDRNGVEGRGVDVRVVKRPDVSA